MIETIDVKSGNGNIIISEGVRSRRLKLKSTNGNCFFISMAYIS